MKIISKTTKVLVVSKSEIGALKDMLREASEIGRAERQIDRNLYLAIEVDEGQWENMPVKAK